MGTPLRPLHAGKNINGETSIDLPISCVAMF